MGRRYIVNRLRELGEELGRRPLIHELLNTGNVTRKDLRENFSSYSEALALAGLITTREQVVKERKKRGYIPPWNYIGGETPMDPETARFWRNLSKEIITKIGVCEEVNIQHVCTDVLVAHHIIPRRCGGSVLSRRNVVVVCNAAHKLQPADLYWRTADDVDFRALPEYQLRRLAEGTYGLASEETVLESSSESDECGLHEMWQ